MSATEKLLSNIHEYHDLLGFLNEKYPQVLKEWKWPIQATTNNNSIHTGTNQEERLDYE
jgi:hypothetical protein